MPLPSTIDDLSTTAALNYPAGTDAPSVLDDTQRAHAAFIAQLRDKNNQLYVATVGGTVDAITLTPSPAITAYSAGQRFAWVASGANTGPVTVAVSGLAAKSLTKNGATALTAGDIVTGCIVVAVYDGTRFQLASTYFNDVNPSKTTVASATTPDIWTNTGELIDYTGTATATGFAAAPQAGAYRFILCAGASVFTAGANMIIPGTASGSNFTAAANTMILVRAITTTQFILNVLRADGAPASRAAGDVLQMLTFTDAGTNTTSGTMATVTLAAKSITPKSSNSNIIVRCVSDCIVSAAGAGLNSSGGFQLYNNTTAALIGSEYTLGVVSGGGANMQTNGTVVCEHVVANSALTAVSFLLRARFSGSSCTVTAASQKWTITEVQA